MRWNKSNRVQSFYRIYSLFDKRLYRKQNTTFLLLTSPFPLFISSLYLTRRSYTVKRSPKSKYWRGLSMLLGHSTGRECLLLLEFWKIQFTEWVPVSIIVLTLRLGLSRPRFRKEKREVIWQLFKVSRKVQDHNPGWSYIREVSSIERKKRERGDGSWIEPRIVYYRVLYLQLPYLLTYLIILFLCLTVWTSPRLGWWRKKSTPFGSGSL